MSNNFITKENIRREQQKFFLNTREIFGIQSINVNYESNASPLKFIGMGNPVFVPNGTPSAGCNINTLVLGSDPFLSLTGNTGFNGYLIKSRDNYAENFSFVSGYLTSYNSRCSIGQIPEISVDFVAFGNVGRLTAAESVVVSGQFAAITGGSAVLSPNITSPGAITLNLDDFTTNRVLSYDLSININRNAIYPLGIRVPTKVEINYPIEVVLGFQFVVNDYVPHQVHKFPYEPKTKNISLSLRSHSDDSLITNYTFPNLFLVQEQQTAGTEGPVIISAVYKGYYNSGDSGSAGQS